MKRGLKQTSAMSATISARGQKCFAISPEPAAYGAKRTA
jgi:hypothetical protein